MVQVVTVLSNTGLVPRPSHKPELGWFVYLLAGTAVIGGFLFGYDTGVVSAAMLYVPKNGGMTPMSDFWKELVVSITPGCASIGALFGSAAGDRFGRRKVILLASFLFTIGGVVCAISFSKWSLLVGRVLIGIGLGFASMTIPIYVGEASPAYIRGILVTGFQLMINFGMTFANVIAGAFSYIDPDNIGWRLMFGFAAVPAIIQFIGFLFLPESPRWLFVHRGKEECEQVLQRVYHGDKLWVEYEIEEIRTGYEQEERDKIKHGGNFVLGRILTTPPVRKALIIGCLLQAFQQFSGINTIMYYTGTIIRSSGIKDDHTTIWISVGTAGALLVFTIIPLKLVETVGRRILLIASDAGVLLSLLLMGGAFLMINRDSAKVSDIRKMNSDPTLFNSSVKDFAHCNSYTNCDFCVTDERCGFCSESGYQRTNGYCLPVNSDSSDKQSSTGVCANPETGDWHVYNSTVKYEWADVYCHTRWTAIPIILMVVYLAFFSAGFAPMPWVLNAEFYPLWARSTCMAISTFTNWSLNLLISLTFLSLSEAVTKFGAFFIYSGLTLIGLIVFIIFVPETKGCSIDEVEMLFMTEKDRRKIRAESKRIHPDLDHTNGYINEIKEYF